jgi:DMSO/TMAO reductase YedYZ molybdopterin-dependent catalytic subunit
MKNRSSDGNQQLGDRRQFLAGVSIGAVSIAASPVLPLAHGQESATALDTRTFKGLITREREPVNLEFPFASLNGVKTPNNQFFIRTHFPMPTVNRDDWRLKCSGHVEHELVLSFDDLRKLPSKTITATIECAGNSRVFLVLGVTGLVLVTLLAAAPLLTPAQTYPDHAFSTSDRPALLATVCRIAH